MNIKIKLFQYCPLRKLYFIVHRTSEITPREYIVKNSPQGIVVINNVPPDRGILRINSSCITLSWRTIQTLIIMILKNYIMSV